MFQDEDRLLEVWVKGEPQPKGSPRVRMAGNRAMTYMPKKTREYIDLVADVTRSSRASTIDQPVFLVVVVHPSRPKSVPESKRRWPSVKPDLDNYCKAILDGLVQGGALRDDSLVVGMLAYCDYSTEAQARGAYVAAWPVAAWADIMRCARSWAWSDRPVIAWADPEPRGPQGCDFCGAEVGGEDRSWRAAGPDGSLVVCGDCGVVIDYCQGRGALARNAGWPKASDLRSGRAQGPSNGESGS